MGYFFALAVEVVVGVSNRFTQNLSLLMSGLALLLSLWCQVRANGASDFGAEAPAYELTLTAWCHHVPASNMSQTRTCSDGWKHAIDRSDAAPQEEDLEDDVARCWKCSWAACRRGLS